MATIMEMLNQGIGGLNTPLGQLGTSLLAQSGPQAGNPGGGARLGQALAGMSELQRQQALQQYRNQQIQLAEQQQQMALQQAKAKSEQQQRLQQAMQDPNFLASLGPMAKQMAQLGVDPGELIRAQNADNLASHRAAAQQQAEAHFQAQMAARGGSGGGGQPPGPKQPANRQIYEEPLENNMIQKHIFDPATNSYKPLGKPYQRFAPTKADPLQSLIGEVMPDNNVGAGPAVPGLPGSNVSSMSPPQGAELLMHGSGSNPMARPAAPAVNQPQYPGAPAVGTVVKGFKFLGGNPADPKSWSKV